MKNRIIMTVAALLLVFTLAQAPVYAQPAGFAATANTAVLQKAISSAFSWILKI